MEATGSPSLARLGHRNGLATLLLGLPLLAEASGCALDSSTLSVSAVEAARAGFQRYSDTFSLEEREKVEPPVQPSGSVFVGELLAIFPGLFWPGLGHHYAGDYDTSRKLLRVGEMGVALTALGVAAGFGGYSLDRNDQEGFAYGLYATGGVLGVIGVTYWMSAWFYDMVDTPRAVRTGGRPPPRSEFVETLDIFEG